MALPTGPSGSHRLKAIETRYKGYRFRSRLEARWAVFFDTLGIRWEYEPEGYQLANGTYYLPDFWLPELAALIEIKPDDLQLEQARQEPVEARKIREAAQGLSETRKQSIAPVMLCGTPGSENVYVYAYDVTDGSGGEGWWEFAWHVRGGFNNYSFSPFCDAEFYSNGEVRRSMLRPYVGGDLGYEPFNDDGHPSSEYISDSRHGGIGYEIFILPAYTAARSARFEHGETP